MFVIRDVFGFTDTPANGMGFETRDEAEAYLASHGYEYDKLNDNGGWLTRVATAGGWAQIALYVKIVEE